MFSKLFYRSAAVWTGAYKQNIHKLQLMLNFAARILTDTGKYDHITPALKALGWLTIEELLWLRDVTIMYNRFYTKIFKNLHSRPFSKTCVFVARKRRLRVDGRLQRRKEISVFKISGCVLTGPQKIFMIILCLFGAYVCAS